MNKSTAVRRALGFSVALAGLILAALTLSPQTALASHPTEALDASLSEGELRAVETQTLGAAHAAEHAQLRALEASQPQQQAPETRAAADPQLRVAGPPAQVGQWNPPVGLPVVGINAVLLPTGKVLFWDGGPNVRAENTAQAWLWDPATATSKRVDPPLWRDPADGQLKPVNIWCSGQSLLGDGRVLVAGGNLANAGPTPEFKGLNKIYTFNPFSETWTEQPDMAHGRWYPTQSLLPDGRALIISGWDEAGNAANNPDIDLFTPSADLNGVGSVQTIATRGGSGPPAAGGLYPHMFGLPSGRTLVAGPYPEDSWFVDQITPFSWSQAPNLPTVPDFSPGNNRSYGSGILAPGGPGGSGIVNLIGGGLSAVDGGGASRTSISFNEGSPSAGWSSGPSMQIARTHQNTVLLPDSSMVAIGGGVGRGSPNGLWQASEEQKQVELYDPATQSWRLGASQQETRAYHSTAVLLPDGRVLSAGDERNGAGPDTAEIYEPPYLFKGQRPAIASAPTSVAWGDSFGINSPDPVSRAVLMAPGATTHANDMNQRHVELQVTGAISGVGVNVVSPPNTRVAPPGYYMLFLLDAQGVPSVSRWVRLGPSAPDRPPLFLDPGVVLPKKPGGKSPSVKVKGKYLILRIRCELPAGSASPCIGSVGVTAKAGGDANTAAKKKLIRIASGSYSVPVGTTGKVKAKLTKRGRALVKEGKLKATVTLTNKLNNASERFKVKL